MSRDASESSKAKLGSHKNKSTLIGMAVPRLRRQPPTLRSCAPAKSHVAKSCPSHLKKRPTILPASLLASPDPKAPFARLDAWENLSARLRHRVLGIYRFIQTERNFAKDVAESGGRVYLKATVFVMVSINAIAVSRTVVVSPSIA